MKNNNVIPAIFWGILSGHFLLILSGIAYSMAWILNYSGGAYSESAAAGILIFGSLLLGIIGIIILINCITILSENIKNKKLKIRHIFLAGVIFFILALIVTTIGFKRIFTTELILITLWTFLEISVIYAIHYSQCLSKPQTIFAVFLIAVSVLTGIFCYTIHYTLSGFIQFLNGLIPYMTVSIVNIIIIAMLFFNKRAFRL